MRRICWILFVFFVLSVGASGCIDLSEEVERGCEAADLCAAEMDEVCGEDGEWYACAPLAECENIGIDPSGAACESAPQECPPLECDPHCEELKRDENGCEICECAELSCSEEDPCVGQYDLAEAIGCELSSEQSQGDAQLDLGALSPQAICECAEDDCSLQRCTSDDDCGGPGERGLCVVHPGDSTKNYCVDETCETLQARYAVEGEAEQQWQSCNRTEDCKTAYMPLTCCGAIYVNDNGELAFESVSEIVQRTSCYEEVMAYCQDSGTACDAPARPTCIEGVCAVGP